MAAEGFYVFGIDYSNKAILEAKALTNGLPNVELSQGRMDSIQYSDKYFDAIICSHVIQHGLKNERDKAFEEMHRILRQNGLLFLRTISRNHATYGKGDKVEQHTFVNIPELPDGKTPHHYFSDEELKECLHGFDIISLQHHSFPLEPDSFWKHGLEEWALLSRKK